MNDVSTARDIMIIIWKDPNMRLHGKRHKNDRYYFRWHYGKQRRVWISKEYVDKPTESQVSAREAFTALRREVARQLRDAVLREAWERRFAEDNEGYKFLHTYVYAMMKAEQRLAGSAGKEQNFRSAEVQKCRSVEGRKFRGVEGQKFRDWEAAVIMVWNGMIVPIFGMGMYARQGVP